MVEERAVERVKSLISLGRDVRSSVRHPGPNVICESWVDDELFYQWRTSSLHFLKTVFGEKGTHYIEFDKKCRDTGVSKVDSGIGILNSALIDISSGFLKNIESLVSADIFSEFIDMAEYLLTEGYHIPAASLAGAVLEDSLKKICIANGLEVKKNDRLASLNEKLHTGTIYNKIVWKNVDIWREIRNAADHGSFEEFTPDQVKAMISGIRDFMGKHLT